MQYWATGGGAVSGSAGVNGGGGAGGAAGVQGAEAGRKEATEEVTCTVAACSRLRTELQAAIQLIQLLIRRNKTRRALVCYMAYFVTTIHTSRFTLALYFVSSRSLFSNPYANIL